MCTCLPYKDYDLKTLSVFLRNNLKPVLQLDVACMAVGDGFAAEGIYHVVPVKAQEPMLVKLLAD